MKVDIMILLSFIDVIIKINNILMIDLEGTGPSELKNKIIL